MKFVTLLTLPNKESNTWSPATYGRITDLYWVDGCNSYNKNLRTISRNGHTDISVYYFRPYDLYLLQD